MKSVEYGFARLRLRDLVVGLMLGLACFAIYNSNARTISAVDTYAARYLPFAIWRDRTLTLDTVSASIAQGRAIRGERGKDDPAWWILAAAGGKLASYFPIVTPVVVSPVYLPAVLYLNARARSDGTWDPHVFDHVARIMEKLTASMIAGLSVAVVFLMLRRRADIATAAGLALVFGLGTTTWVISSQALWSHGLAQLLIGICLVVLTGPASRLRAIVVGLCCALLACNRPPDAILAAGLGAYGLVWSGRWRVWLIVISAIPVLLLLAYNQTLFGNPVGGYGTVSRARLADFFDHGLGSGLAGLLFSPTRGLFLFSPFLLVLLFGFRAIGRDPRTRLLTLCVCAAVLLQTAFYALGDWRQGVSWGPRWLTDLLPMLFFLLPPVIAVLSGPARSVFAAACAVAIAIQLIGAFWYAGVADAAIVRTAGPEKMGPAWSFDNAPYLAELRHTPVAGDLFVRATGSIDLVRPTDEIDRDGHRIYEVHGWALADLHAPALVTIRINGNASGATSTFFERADVAKATGSTAPSGWMIRFSGARLKPGEQTFSLLVNTRHYTEARLIAERKLTVDMPAPRTVAASLADSAKIAAQRLAERQQPDGYWLTAHTMGTVYEGARPELNTFLNAVLIDILAPVEIPSGLRDNIARARSFLTAQIEPDGLVRYHGRPDSPVMGRLGCPITPDADDTALTWRVAPPNAGLDRRDQALAVLEQYRRGDGLYRTWLAPRERYQCLDPGADPNPADISIQLHVMMFLAGVNPPAAKALCSAVQAKAGDPSIWVYYRIVPLMVLLRLEDIGRLGCPLDVPDSFKTTWVVGQGTWLDVAKQVSITGKRDQARADELLKLLAADDFALIRTVPPLIYHNDLSATVSRFYWSEDLGYALWLRLFHQSAKDGSAR